MKNSIYVLKTKRGRATAGRCQFPMCCNFYSLEIHNRKYCKNHKRIPDSKKASCVSKVIEERGDWVITTSISVKRKEQ